jgi:hypothetical protein
MTLDLRSLSWRLTAYYARPAAITSRVADVCVVAVAVVALVAAL